MKKYLLGIMALIICCGVFCSCDNKDKEEQAASLFGTTWVASNVKIDNNCYANLTLHFVDAQSAYMMIYEITDEELYTDTFKYYYTHPSILLVYDGDDDTIQLTVSGNSIVWSSADLLSPIIFSKQK